MAFDPAYRQKIMNNALSILRNFMVEEKIDFLLVNSTNEFLVEYISLAENSRYHLTGFTGSTGDALVTMNDVFLFVDGRYHIQADQEVDHKITTVVKLQTGQSFLEEMLNKIPKNSTLGVFARKNSQATIEKIQSHVKTKLLPIDPLDLFENIASQEMISLSDNFTGKPSEDKINEIALKDDEALLLTNLEEVSYLFNMRNFSTQFSSVIKAKAVILQDEAHLFLDGFDVNYKSVNAKHLLIWKLMEKYATEGFERFNLGGMSNPLLKDDNKYKGLNDFKLCFGAKAVEYIGDLELITNPILYAIYRNGSPFRKMKKKKDA